MTTRRGLVAAVAVAVALIASTGCSDTTSGAQDAAPTVEAQTTAVPTTTIRPQTPLTVLAPEGALVTQPAQPTSGPGSSALPSASWRESSGGVGADAWYVFEPTGPQPASAPVAVVMHGYYEYSGYHTMHGLIEHTVKSGSIVIYPRWQTGTAEPCPGPFDIEPCIASAVNAIHDAIAYLQADPARVQPELDHTSYFGQSFGGIITANMANRHEELGLPPPRAILLDEPHDSGLTGTDEPALDDSLAGIPPATLVVCHVGAEGVIAEAGMEGASCNSLFAELDHIPKSNKSLVMTRPDDHGLPALSSRHGVCGAPPGEADAYDWNFCWRTFDALRSAAIDGDPDLTFAFGDTPEQQDLGTWSDGVPITPLQTQTAAPIRP